MKNNQPVVFFDSGVGGLPYLALSRERNPHENYIYVADRLHYPLGDKTQDEIRCAVMETFSLVMERFAPKLAVVACNTASVAALATLRARFPIPFVGVVPAVKPAAALSKTGRIGVLATPQTVRADYLTGLINDFAKHCNVSRIPAPRLRDFVEEDFFTASAQDKAAVIREAADAVRAADVDVLVLACTHFLHAAADLQRELGDGVRLIDSREGVVAQYERVLKKHGLQTDESTGRAQFFVTGNEPVAERHLAFARLFSLEPGGNLV